MTKEEFIDMLRIQVEQSSVTSTIKGLDKIHGRSPTERMKQLVDWYGSLSDHNKRMLQIVIGINAHACLFGMLALLDGERVVDNHTDHGELELFYVRENKKYRLNGKEDEPLHDILNAMPFPPESGSFPS